MLIPLMQRSIMDRNAYDFPCFYLIYIYKMRQYQINIKPYGQIDVNV